jgi:hypothetical protein
MVMKDRKVNLTYHVTAGVPYLIGSYKVNVKQADLYAIAQNDRNVLVRTGEKFNADLLNQERQRVASAMRSRGYFYFDAECLRFEVDSLYKQQRLDVKMCLQPYVEQMTPEEKERLFRQYKIANVHFYIDYDLEHIPDGEEILSSTKKGYVFTWIGKKLLREQVLVRNCPIRSGSRYNERLV